VSLVLETIVKTYVGTHAKIAPTLKVQCANCARVYQTTQWPLVVRRLTQCASCRTNGFKPGNWMGK
jgi:hypothetical protein